MKAEPQTVPSRTIRRVQLLWWQVVLIACAVVVTLSMVVIVYAELRQAHYLRQSNCAERVRAGGQQLFNSTGEAEQALRRCFGIAERE